MSGVWFAAERSLMPSSDRDPLTDDLAGLPQRSPSRELDAHVRGRAVATFERSAGTKGRGGMDVRQVFARIGVPVLLAGSAVTYLTWAVQVATALYR
jgi:hypothetical protein